jgi:hypothetical protein
MRKIDKRRKIKLNSKKTKKVKTKRVFWNFNFLQILKVISPISLSPSFKIHHRKLQLFFVLIILSLIFNPLGIATFSELVLADNHTEQQAAPEAQVKASPIEVVGQATITDDLALGTNSYAGEIVSKMDVNVYSAREGVITNLNVGIGDTVWQGQAIGQISFPIEFDQIATNAEKRGEVDVARGELDAINSQLNDVRNRLNSRKSSAEAAKNAAIANANNQASTGEITSQERDELIREAESDYSEVVTDADNEITDLTREQKEAEKSLQVAQGVSNTVSGGLDRNIYAIRGGVISGIFKNVGDSVEINDPIAAIGIANPTLKDRCVRFRIPANQVPPKVGDIVTISRPGIPLATQQATIIGVGTALDDNGQIVAEASFEEIVDWPVHTPVRVQVESQSANEIFIPLSAVWFDNEGVTSVWLADNNNKITAYNVTTGRAVGDRIEITKGLVKGDRVVLNPQDDFKNNDVIQESGSMNTNQGEEVQPEGDGHDHEH